MGRRTPLQQRVSFGVREAVIVGILLTGSCSCSEEPLCDLWIASAIVYGSSVSTEGAAVPNVEFELSIRWTNSCADSLLDRNSERFKTDENGDYRVELQLGNERGRRCIAVREMTSAVISKGVVEFTGGCGDRRPPGQLELDVIVASQTNVPASARAGVERRVKALYAE